VQNNLFYFSVIPLPSPPCPLLSHTLEVLSPAVVTVSDSGPDRVRVSWGPLQPEQVQRYQIEYGALPSGQVHMVMLHGHQNTTLLTGLEQETQYLVTISALYSTGKEKALSVKACTQEGKMCVFLFTL
jgi:hypothetical protein